MTQDRPTRVLIIDDVPVNLSLLEGILLERQFEVASFPRGRLALAAMETNPPDLVLLDVSMPEMNGYEVCAAMRQNPLLKDIPVLFLSAANEEADKLRGFQAGGMDFITKPFHVEEVLARVNTHIQLARSRRDIAEKNRALEALTAELRAQNEALKSAFAQIKVLKEFLPICSGCKKIRDDQGEWQDVDTYLSTHSDITFTHGLCPGCFKRYYPDYAYPTGKG